MNAWPILARTFAIASIGCLLFPAVRAQDIKIDKSNRTIAVTATDSAETMADTALIHIGFVVYAPDAQAAYAEGSKTSNAIAKALTDVGIVKSALQSESQSIAETQPYEMEKLPPAEQAQRKFRVQQSWTVKTKADDAAKVLNLAINAGANQSGQITWAVTDENALEAQAAGKALARARLIAAQMAQGLGIKLGDLLYASNQAAEPRPLMMRSAGVAGMAAGGMLAEKSAPAPLSIHPHKIQRSATVYAVFAIQ